MMDYYELDNLINNFIEEFKNIRFEKTGETHVNNFNTYNFNTTTFNYIDTSFNLLNPQSIVYNIPNIDREENEKTKENTEEQDGNHPIIFLLASSVLTFGTTYLIATDEYTKVTNKFKILDQIIDKLTYTTKHTSLESNTSTIKINYQYLKNSIMKQFSPKYYSKLGLLGSSFLTLTYFYPFGTFALFPGIIALTGFGCYWLWNHLTCDEYTNIQNLHYTILQNLYLFKQQICFSTSHPYNNSITQDIVSYDSPSKYPIKYILPYPSQHYHIQPSAPLNIP